MKSRGFFQWIFGIAVILFFSQTAFAELSMSFVTDVPFTVSSEEVSNLEISQLSATSLSSSTATADVSNLILNTTDLTLSASVTQNIALKVMGKLLNYPNPFSISKGQTEIGYRLTTEAYLTLNIYSLSGHLVYSQAITPSDYGAAQYNKIPISKTVLSGSWLTPGVYIYVLVHEGKVLAKNRMVIVP